MILNSGFVGNIWRYLGLSQLGVLSIASKERARMRKSYNARDSLLQQRLIQPKVNSVKIENHNAYLLRLNNYAQFQVIWNNILV